MTSIANATPAHTHALLVAAKEVMDLLEKHGGSIVPHLIDSDQNAGQRLRDAIHAVEAITGRSENSNDVPDPGTIVPKQERDANIIEGVVVAADFSSDVQTLITVSVPTETAWGYECVTLVRHATITPGDRL